MAQRINQFLKLAIFGVWLTIAHTMCAQQKPESFTAQSDMVAVYEDNPTAGKYFAGLNHANMIFHFDAVESRWSFEDGEMRFESDCFARMTYSQDSAMGIYKQRWQLDSDDFGRVIFERTNEGEVLKIIPNSGHQEYIYYSQPTKSIAKW